MESTKLSFAIDANQIDIKPLLQKEFLELSMRAISSANPNRNNSWFTPESMEKSIGSFKNKPILGYFENGDFVSHNGEWKDDPETDMAYWDTLNQKGERILGLIRSEDDVQIVKDENDVSWICLTCALWTQYSYKQVKRLLKDAKRAKINGGSTKNISVEVDITDYEMLPNGVMKINEFNLVGITILGSRNGIKVEPGIEDAELSVVDIMGKEYFAQQQQALRLAYEKLDNSQQDNKKEDFSQVETENKDITIQEESTVVTTDNTDVETFEQAPEVDPVQAKEECPECGSEDGECDCESKCEEEKSECEEKQCEEQCKEHCEEDPEDDHDEDEDDDHDEDEKDHEPEHCEEQSQEEKVCEEEKSCDLSEKESEGIQHEEEILEQEEKQCEEEQEGQPECEAVKEGYTLETLYEAYQTLRSENKALLSKVHEFEKKEFLQEAKSVISSIELSEKQANEFFEKCCNEEITTVDDLKVKIAVAVMFTEDHKTKVEKTETYNAPIVAPNTQITSGKAEKAAKSDKWEALHSYIGR